MESPAAALRTLRQLPPGSNKRETVIGFGDPFFNAQQAAEAEQQKIRAIIQTMQPAQQPRPAPAPAQPRPAPAPAVPQGLAPGLPQGTR